MFEKTDLKIVIFPSLFFVLFALVLKASGISVISLVNLHNDLLKKAIISTAGMGTYEGIGYIISSFSFLLAAVFLLVLGLAFIAAYGTKEDDYANAIVPAAIGSLTLFFLSGISVITIAISIALIAASAVAMTQASFFFNELKKWRFFRTGSKSVGSALTIFNAIVAIGVLVAVVSAQPLYERAFKDDMKKSLVDVAVTDIQDENSRALVRSMIEDRIENSQILQGYLRFLPLAAAFGVWVLLEFAKIIAVNIGGVMAHFLLKK